MGHIMCHYSINFYQTLKISNDERFRKKVIRTHTIQNVDYARSWLAIRKQYNAHRQTSKNQRSKHELGNENPYKLPKCRNQKGNFLRKRPRIRNF